METIAVIDFESTGESTSHGGRATEVAIILMRGNRAVDRFQSLMNAGAWIIPFAEELTGITNEMIRSAPPASKVMREAARFVGAHPMCAHNASFDSALWRAELKRLGLAASNPYACTMLLARRLYPNSPDHKLGTLARQLRLPSSGRAHRAMADTEMAAGLLCRIQESIRSRHGLLEAPHALLSSIQKIPKDKFQDKVPLAASSLGVPKRPTAAAP